MTDEQIIKALEEEKRTAIRINHRFMEACDTENPDDDRFITLLIDTLDLINRQRAEIKQKDTEIDILIRKNETLKDEVLELRKEIERLQKHKEYAFCNLLGNCLVFSKNLKDYNDMREGLKSEARLELVRRISKSIGFCDLPNAVVRGHIDKVLNEMER